MSEGMAAKVITPVLPSTARYHQTIYRWADIGCCAKCNLTVYQIDDMREKVPGEIMLGTVPDVLNLDAP